MYTCYNKDISLLLVCLLFALNGKAQVCSSLSNRAKFVLSHQFSILTDTRNPCDWGAPAQGQYGRDIYYSISLPDTMNLLVHNLGSQVSGTEITFYPDSLADTSRTTPKALYYQFLQQMQLWQEDYLNSQDCYILQNLPPGTYTFTVHGTSVSNASIVNGETKTTVVAWKDNQLRMPLPPACLMEGMRQQPKEIGSYGSAFSYNDTIPIIHYADYYGADGIDAGYHLQLTDPMQLSVIFPDSYERIYLLNSFADRIHTFSEPDNVSLQPGDYWLIAETANNNAPFLTLSLYGTEQNVELVAPAESANGSNFITHHIYTEAAGESFNTEITYYDGLGRVEETVKSNASPAGGDIATFQTYDLAGKPSQAWLPATFPNGDGSYIDSATFISQATINDSHPYSLQEYEASPLGRATRLTGAGSAWHTAQKAAQTEYTCNGNNENVVRAYTISPNGQNLCQAENVAVATYSGTRTTDEDGRTIEVYKDLLGNVRLERRNDGTETLDTYYVYDRYNQLRVVIPPMAVNNLHLNSNNAGTWSLNSDEVIQQYAYVYKYDDHGRVSDKRLPGCDWMHYWYDKSGRMAFSQDGEQNNSGICTFYLYDGFKREVMRGECNDSYTSNSQQRENLATYVGTGDLAGYACDWLNATDATLLSVNYYDNYDFLSLQSDATAFQPDTTDDSYQQIWTNGSNQPFASGQLTGTITYNLLPIIPSANSSTYQLVNLTTYYYDYRSLPVQQISTNHLGGIDRTYIAYDFTGNITQQRVVHSTNSTQAGNGQTSIVNRQFSYDSWGRPLTTTLSVNNAEPVTICSNTYDELGRLASTSRNNQASLTTEYDYNIRDWVTEISTPAFTENLYYNTSLNGSTPQWGGNISAMAWKAGSDFQNNKLRSYNFTYDGVSRLTAANYWENNTASNKYSTAYSYDAMGNILAMQRSGLQDDGDYGVIDQLLLEYNGNQLQWVDEDDEHPHDEPTYAHAMHFTDGAFSNVEYEYNANGAMTKDKNKGIDVIEYNALNLPQAIYFNNGKNITSYTYGADGKKLRAQYFHTPTPPQPSDPDIIILPPQAQLTLTRDYCGPFIYENGTLERILFDGGYITFDEANSNTPEYHFYTKDHLGNIRVVQTANGAIEEVNHYYPYGSLFGESTGLANSTQPYKYTGKELDRMHGLDLHDHGARWSDTNLGRWWKIDPLAEGNYANTPYSLCNDNPIKYFDPDGRKVKVNGIEEFQMILGTMSADAWPFIKIDKDGYIDQSLLNQYSGNSYNFNCLREMAIDPMTISVELASEFAWAPGDNPEYGLDNPYPMNCLDPDYLDITPDPLNNVNDVSSGQTGLIGKTLFPDKDGIQNSIDSDIHVVINKQLTQDARVDAYKHEANGHALLYIRSRYNHQKASHHPVKGIDTNRELVNLILKSRRLK